MTCEACNVACQRFGKHRNGLRRFRCPQCKRTYTEPHQRVLDAMYIPEDRIVLALQLLLEGNSIRSTERITQLDRNTIMRLLVLAGERCEKLMDARMRNLTVKHLQIDEIWTYVGKKATPRSQGRFARSWRPVGFRCHRCRHETGSRVSHRQAPSARHARVFLEPI